MPSCKGTGEIKPTILFSDELEKNLEFIVGKIKTQDHILHVHPFIAAFLTKGPFPIYLRWDLKYRILLRSRL
jgi:ribonuclease G